MNFPHLADTTFPDISTVNVYQFQNNFDYTRWNENTKIKLCNVLWNSDYTDVVKFDTDSERDSWFDNLRDVWTLELKTASRIVPEGYIKLPIPYDVMARYNYLFVDMPIATSEDAPLDYENPNGLRRWYFFVNDITYLSPNATQVFVLPDIWTNFQNSIDIPYMLLERGHAPVAYSDTDSYLSNPIQNNRYLLAPDVNFDNASITRSSTYVPFGNGTKYVCFATTVDPDSMDDLGAVTANSEYSPSGTITYEDLTGARYGHQLVVHGFGYGNGRDYSDANTPASVGFSDGLIANNLSVYAIPATECYRTGTFFSDLQSKCPQFLTTVKACFVVDSACITMGQSYQLAGHTIYKCEGKSATLLNKQLTRNDFSYPQELQRFAKLYTSPYAALEITDNDGKTCEVNIEETSTLSVKAVTSVAYPYINERVFLTGIGGVGSSSYKWVDLNGSESTLQMYNSDWFKYCFDWKIPTFALYMDGETAFQLENFNRVMRQGKNNSLVDYHCTMRSANTAYENVLTQSDVAYTNTDAAAATARDNSYDSAYTSRVNTDNVVNLAKHQSDQSTLIQFENNKRMLLNTQSNNEIALTESQYLEFYNICNSSHITWQSIDLAEWNYLIANSNMVATTDVNILKTQAIATQTGNAAILSSTIKGTESMAVTGMGIGAQVGAAGGPIGMAGGAALGALAGAVIGGSTGGIQATLQMNNAATIQNADQVTTDCAIAVNLRNWETNTDTTSNIQVYQNDTRDETSVRHTESSRQQMQYLVDSQTTVLEQTRDLSYNNAIETQDCGLTNAANTENTVRHTSYETYVTTERNADRTRDNVQENAWYTRQVSELNAKEILENAKDNAMASIDDARNRRPIECCPYSGNPDADYMRTRGLQIKVKTQSDSAIRQAGDTFARYGYALNQIWDVKNSGLKLMRHFTYWKATEIWVDDRDASNNSVNTYIKAMFMSGVTIWNDPTKVGKVNVYEN